ncbi:M24 family metallopeptidase [Paenarthrobacter sp. NPDC090522]|uniref:M24 family metallopeptidase n=1 Tax=Paenarthrobacter sp. NPDC090522 TaxID=3364383 RepID=UPI0038121C26
MTKGLFTQSEYQQRIERTQKKIAELGADYLVVPDPANIFYLTGFDAYSFYNPQLLLVPREGALAFFCRGSDASSAWLAAELREEQVFGYSDTYVQKADVHPMDWVAQTIRPWLPVKAVIAVESEAAFYTLRAHKALVEGLGGSARVIEVPNVINRLRAIKSPAEIALMRDAGKITSSMFEAAFRSIRPGVRECDAVAEIYAAQLRGVEGAGGTYSAIPPLLMAGDNTSFPHVPWSDRPFADNDPIALEIAGSRYRYHVPLTRTLHTGQPPAELQKLAEIVGEGLEAALSVIRPGAECQDPALAWNSVIKRHGLSKSTRIGYPIGLGFPPDWGEQTMSFLAGDRTPLEAGMTWHVMIGMWLDTGGYSISETVLVTENGAECLASVPRGLLTVG